MISNRRASQGEAIVLLDSEGLDGGYGEERRSLLRCLDRPEDVEI